MAKKLRDKTDVDRDYGQEVSQLGHKMTILKEMEFQTVELEEQVKNHLANCQKLRKEHFLAPAPAPAVAAEVPTVVETADAPVSEVTDAAS